MESQEPAGRMTPEKARLLNPLQLAYIGDTVWDLMARQELLLTGGSVRNLHKGATALVNAGAQAKALARMREILTDQEEEIVRRGRNAQSRHGAPKNQDPADYANATGLEALIGYLYLTGENQRLEQLWRKGKEDITCN